VPQEVELDIADRLVSVRGPRGALSHRVAGNLTLEREDGLLRVVRHTDDREDRALHGLTRTLINNMVLGVTTGYRKDLEISGVGYRAAKEGDTLVLSVGFSHPVRMVPPEGITFIVDSQTRLAVQGIDKQVVGEQAAQIRAVRPPEPYKGKGIRYAGEQIRRKAGKSGKAGGRK